MTSHRITLLVGAVLARHRRRRQAAGDITIVRDLAGRVGPVDRLGTGLHATLRGPASRPSSTSFRR